MEKVLLIGGSGFFGSEVYSKLSQNYSVEVMSRFKHADSSVDGKAWIEGDITSKADVERVMDRGYDVVFDFVGLITQKEQKHRAVNVGGIKNIIDTAVSLGTEPRVIYISAINAENGTTEYFKTKHEAENLLSGYKKHTVIRPSILYGKDDFLTKQFFSLLNRNIPVFPRSGIICPVSVKDMVTVVESLMHLDGSFNVCSEEKIRFGDMFNIFRERFGRKGVPQAPMALFKVLSPVLEHAGIVSSEQIKMLEYDFYRGDSVLKKYVKDPVTYKEFVGTLVLPPLAAK
ncbi:MAG: NAD-dependent epimerase/dehydratase family protein [Candidatus Marsarchaeota archaeon]|nr:NAD-dependent epimerase/dehydratase family protein [Candidatus Marsarchaeota archaeon]MCL5102090.1 NAD-dependent epimerase/dehydratase family protein [Candidatus Marsarchaeota archaeon]